MLAAAHRYLEAAAVFERLGGADWQLIGDVLGLPAHTARTRYENPETAFRNDLLSPGNTRTPRGPIPLLTHIAREPLETALDLDEWVLHHQDGDNNLGPTPVSHALSPQAPQRRPEPSS
ncbi:hypothetical protein GCM10027168_41950 [Streptomyces capparidis]